MKILLVAHLLEMSNTLSRSRAAAATPTPCAFVEGCELVALGGFADLSQRPGWGNARDAHGLFDLIIQARRGRVAAAAARSLDLPFPQKIGGKWRRRSDSSRSPISRHIATSGAAAIARLIIASK